MIKSLRKEYFQKSQVFLYPFLKIPKGNKYVPVNTYTSWVEGINLSDKKFLCVYALQSTEEFYKFENKYLLTNPLFENFYLLDNNHGVFIFDYQKFSVNYDKLIASKYSKMTEDFKQVIIEFFKTNDINNVAFHHVNSYLYPDLYFGRYADLLSVDKDVLIKVGELCPPFNSEKETLQSTKLIADL